MTERKLPEPARLTEKCKPLRDRVIPHIEPSRKLGPVGLRRNQDTAVEAGTAACHAKLPADFVAKMAIVEEEYDESIYWMELIVEAGLMDEKRLNELKNEANEILSMVVASIKTARSRK